MSETHSTPFPTGQLADGVAKAIMFDSTVCIGCRQCVQACKDWNDHPRTSVYEMSSTTWITMEPPALEGQSPIWARNSCMHCEFPMCAAVCPVEAITKYDEGPVVIDPETCIGCEYCIYACPWGVISKDEETHKAKKCTMCNDRVAAQEEPFCVQACPVDALAYGAADEIAAKARERATAVGGHVYGEKEAGGTHLRYVLKETPAAYGLREVGSERYPTHSIPGALMFKDLFTLRLGMPAKVRALYLAFAHPKRLAYRYWPWRTPEQS